MDYNDKYKDKKPNETIGIIKNFFKSRGFVIDVSLNEQTIINTWICGMDLYFEGIKCLHSNGKGITEEYSLASGYAELYERFCNKTLILSNSLIVKKIMKYNKKEHGWYFDKNEKILTLSEAFSEPFLQNLSEIIKPQKLESLYTKNFSKFIGLPFSNLKNNDKKYIDPRLLNSIFGTTGLATGNTISEALVQGISEICERHVVVNLIKSKNSKIFYYLDINCLKNKELKEKINLLEKNGNLVFVFDLSYNFELPVIATLLVNKKTYNFDINYAAHPIFDIALERTLTEICQVEKYEYAISKTINKPLKSSEISTALINCGSGLKTYIPEYLLLNSKQINCFNNEVFIDTIDINNELLLKKYINLFDKLDFQLYYYDSSLSKEIYSVQIYSPNTIDLSQYAILDDIKYKRIEKLTDEKIYYLERFVNFFNNFQMEEEKNFFKRFEYFIGETDLFEGAFWFNFFNLKQILTPYGESNITVHELFVNLKQNHNLASIYSLFSNTFFNNRIKLVLLIKMYKESKKYSDKEIIKLFSYMGVDKKFIKECDIIVDGILKPYYEEYNSERYQRYCETYCK